jgi:hypothetical protein
VLSSTGNGFEPASWWPNGGGILYWFDPDFSASIAADGLALDSLNLSTEKSTTLAATLTYKDWLAWAPSGSVVAIVAGSDRVTWDSSRKIDICSIPAGSCSPVSTAPGLIGLDPTWTAGSTLVFTAAPGASPDQVAPPGIGPVSAPFGAQAVNSWYNRQQLSAAQASGASSTELIGDGAHSPTAIPAGLLYIGSDTLWLRPSRANTSIQLGDSIGPVDPYSKNYYSYIDWSAEYSWHH